MTIDTKIVRVGAKLPTYGRPGDAGMDLYAVEGATLWPGFRPVVIPTGIAMAIPEGYVGLIWDRGGLAARHGITTMAGVVDSNYRGEIGVVLMNVGARPYDVRPGDRVAQMLIQPVANAVLREVQALDDTVRGAEAYGSSGR